MATATLTVLGSSSHGNAYIIKCGEQYLLLELGIDFKQILQALNFDIKNVAGCLVSHKHLDHSKSVSKALKYGLDVYSCASVNGATTLNNMESYKIGDFKVKPLLVPHGDTENYAYIIWHKLMGTLVFATDCEDFKYHVKGCNHLLIEANYSEDIAIQELMDNKEIRSASETHMEINKTLEIIGRHDSWELRNIVLLHLSDQLSDAKKFKESVCASNASVYVAENGLTVNVSKNEF
jgi:phosphoribosyl 1,2-cyclic phosphodiesterase